MKHSISFLTVSIMLMVMMSGSASAQTESDKSLRNAVNILKYSDSEDEQRAAFDLIHTASERNNPYAMNTLGMVYMRGIGVAKDSVKSVYWLTKAGDAGFSIAWDNLGRMYKNKASGVRQDFVKACEYFRKGTEAGSAPCIYSLGFMHYKGLGCKQDYKLAAQLFKTAAESEYTPAEYFYGLCLRNGYGVEQNTDEASVWLNRAANKGYRDAVEELDRPEPENCYMESKDIDNILYDIPLTMPEITECYQDTAMMVGSYDGILVMYDWSGKYIIGEKPVSMTFNNRKDATYGSLIINNDTINFEGGMAADGTLFFTKGSLKMNERYTGEFTPVNYSLEYIRLQRKHGNLAGRLSLYSEKLLEPERPMYIELMNQIGNQNQNEDTPLQGKIRINPNPFISNFTADFTLAHACNSAVVRIFSQSGVKVYEKSIGHLEAGESTVSITPNIPKGIFVLNICAGNQILRTIIKKE